MVNLKAFDLGLVPWIDHLERRVARKGMMAKRQLVEDAKLEEDGDFYTNEGRKDYELDILREEKELQ
jgi:hypothetical protein